MAVTAVLQSGGTVRGPQQAEVKATEGGGERGEGG